MDARLAEVVERAFDYRGYVTVVRRDGSEIVGYIYDRSAAHVDLLDETATKRTRLSSEEIADVRFSGEDATIKSKEMWERRKGTLEPRDTPAYGQWAESRPVLLLVALDRELREVARGLGLRPRESIARGRAHGVDVVVRAIGVGGSAARFIFDEEPRIAISCGFCGALDRHLQPGDLILATSARDEGGASIEADPAVLQFARRALAGMRMFDGAMLHAKSVVAEPDEKRALARSGALAVDMETLSIARAAKSAGAPWLSVRAVIDTFDQRLPEFARTPHAEHIVPALRYAIENPRAIVQLARNARSSARSLREATRRLVEAQQ
jgi:nucleoside phosphorylase